MASYDTFMALRDFVKGKISRYELEGSDPEIYHVREDNSNRGMSVIKLGFNDDKFWKATGIGEDDVWFFKMINSPYTDYEFMDMYAVTDDFKNGYIIFNELNEDNVEKLRLISRYIFPKKFDLESEEFRSEFAEKLLGSFRKETESILDDYHTEKNREMMQSAQEGVNKEMTDYFDNFGFTFIDYDEFSTTVANLIMWYMRENAIHLSIEQLLPRIFETNRASVGGWQENSYEYQDSEKFDSDSFNNHTERMLDKILEKIEEGYDGEANIQDYLDMVERVSKKFQVDKWYVLPKKKDVRFIIENFEMNPDRVVVKLSKALQQRVLKLSEENFYHLLYQPTLFNLEEI